MRAWWCGFALGVIGLQQQAALPGWRGWGALVLLGCFALGVAAWGLRGSSLVASDLHASSDSLIRRVWFSARTRSCIGWSAMWIAAICVGFGYAAWRAETRLEVALPSAWEGRDIEVVGSIKGLPTRDDKGARFLFQIESVDAPIAAFPHVIQLSWIAEGAPPPVLEPGARWHLTVRLKRPHGNANFGVRDAEASLLARNVRATGYVSAPATAEPLQGNARGVSVTVDRWRAALRARIGSVLADAPHRGIVVALAIGAQDEVSAADWLLMRGTGTSHLVAMMWRRTHILLMTRVLIYSGRCEPIGRKA